MYVYVFGAFGSVAGATKRDLRIINIAFLQPEHMREKHFAPHAMSSLAGVLRAKRTSVQGERALTVWAGCG